MPLIVINVEGSLLLGLFMLFVGEPLLMTVAYWAFLAVMVPIFLVTTAGSRPPQPQRGFLPQPACTQRAAGRGQPGRRQEAGRAAEAARARAVRGP